MKRAVVWELIRDPRVESSEEYFTRKNQGGIFFSILKVLADFGNFFQYSESFSGFSAKVSLY